MEVNVFLFKNFQVGNPNKQFQEEVPNPSLPTCMHLRVLLKPVTNTCQEQGARKLEMDC